jgi:CAAX prenyl protease-like protein
MIPFVAPFAAFILLLGLRGVIPFGARWHYPILVVVASVLVGMVSRPLLFCRPVRPFGSVVIGLLVFVIWVAPDQVWPSYRHHWLFENSLTGAAQSSLPVALRTDIFFIGFRVFGTAILVPIIEELFWRGWLLRYLIHSDFLKVPLGTYSAVSFFATALLFATEHGPFWEVGLLAGLIYNWWMLRTRNLTGCMIAHGVTNACLAAFVIFGGHWEYWL